ncbi:MAG: hypothetical protein QM756_24030 [Polyangiaceae bacterium]
MMPLNELRARCARNPNEMIDIGGAVMTVREAYHHLGRALADPCVCCGKPAERGVERTVIVRLTGPRKIGITVLCDACLDAVRTLDRSTAPGGST